MSPRVGLAATQGSQSSEDSRVAFQAARKEFGEFAVHGTSESTSLGPVEECAAASKVGAARDGYRVSWRQNAALATWCVVLMLGYAVTRVGCGYGIPRDCKREKGPVQIGDDLQQLLLMGLVLALFTGLHEAERFSYIFSLSRPRPRGVAFLALFFLTAPAWGSLDFVFPQFSISGYGLRHWSSIALLALTALALLTLFGWHLRRACIHRSWKEFVAYTAPRVIVLGFFVVFNTILPQYSGDYRVHLHHYMVAFIFASLAEFNHPVSLILLAVSTSVFVQGIAAYDAASVVAAVEPPSYRYQFDCASGAVADTPAVSEAFRNWLHNHTCTLQCATACG